MASMLQYVPLQQFDQFNTQELCDHFYSLGREDVGKKLKSESYYFLQMREDDIDYYGR